MEPIVQTYTLGASPEDVWRMLTEPSELDRWWTTRSESEPETGGRFRYVWEFPEEPERNHEQTGRYAEVAALSRIRYPWAVGPEETEVVFELESADGGTSITLRHGGFPDGMEEAYRMHEEGWAMFMNNLKSVLEAGVDRRTDAGLKVG